MAVKKTLLMIAALGLLTYVGAQGSAKQATKASTASPAKGGASTQTGKKSGGKKVETLEEIEARKKSLLMYDENYILHLGSHNSVEFEEMAKQKANTTVVTLVYASNNPVL